MIAPAGSELWADWQPDAALWDNSRRLWSLGDMLRFYAEKFIVTDRYLTQLRIAARDPNVHRFDPSALAKLKEEFAGLSQTLEEMGLLISKEICDELAAKFSTEPPPVPSELQGFVNRLFDIVRRELKSIYFVALSGPEKGMFDPSVPLLGFDFEKKFPTHGAFELDEAAKCMALGRSTATVFHLMRIMEAGIRAIAQCLNIPDPIKPSERNRVKMLESIKRQAASRTKGNPPWVSASDKNIFESAHASLDAVRVAWRDPTMHVENKYTSGGRSHLCRSTCFHYDASRALR
jgi:hypothetical protein